MAWFEYGTIGFDKNIPMNVNHENICRPYLLNIIARLLVKLATVAMNDVCIMTFSSDVTME